MIAIKNKSYTLFPAGVEQMVILCVKAFIKKERRLDYLQANRGMGKCKYINGAFDSKRMKSRAPQMEHSVRNYNEKLNLFITRPIKNSCV